MRLCDDYSDRLSVYADGELAGIDRREVEDHLRACPDCMKRLEALRAVQSRAGEAFETKRRAPDLVESVMDGIGANPARRRFAWAWVLTWAVVATFWVWFVWPPAGKRVEHVKHPRTPVKAIATETPQAPQPPPIVHVLTPPKPVEHARAPRRHYPEPQRAESPKPEGTASLSRTKVHLGQRISYSEDGSRIEQTVARVTVGDAVIERSVAWRKEPVPPPPVDAPPIERPPLEVVVRPAPATIPGI